MFPVMYCSIILITTKYNLIDAFNFLVPTSMETRRDIFLNSLNRLISSKHEANSSLMKRERYEEMIKTINAIKEKPIKTAFDLQKLRRFDVIFVGNEEKLIYPMSEANPTIKYYVCTDEVFEIIHAMHTDMRHPGRDKLQRELQKYYKNITSESIMIYNNLCDGCSTKGWRKKY